jgi:hypothetical protein
LAGAQTALATTWSEESHVERYLELIAGLRRGRNPGETLQVQVSPD